MVGLFTAELRGSPRGVIGYVRRTFAGTVRSGALERRQPGDIMAYATNDDAAREGGVCVVYCGWLRGQDLNL